MASSDQAPPTGAPTPVTPPTRTNTTSEDDPPPKRFAARSNEQSAADYLLDQRRIDQYNTNPRRKHLFVAIKSQSLFNALKTMYTHFIRVNWTHFGRSMEHWSKSLHGCDSTAELAATVYVSHWFLDTYYTIRKSVKSIDPTAYLERYSKSSALFATSYDHFLSTLNAHLRPTHIIGISDAVYIPVLSTNMLADLKNPFPDIKGMLFDHSLFQLVHQIFELRKVCKMTELSSDAMGRPSWLFDVYEDKTAYSWFQQEGNYNDVDVTVTYIVGVPITPKLGMFDADSWVNYPRKTAKAVAYAAHKTRVSSRNFYGLAETRTLDLQQVELPNYYEDDNAKFEALNLGPLRLNTTPAASSSTQEEDPSDVPASPKADAPSDPEKNKVFRIRIIDRLYYAQVIMKSEDATRYAALKIFNKY